MYTLHTSYGTSCSERTLGSHRNFRPVDLDLRGRRRLLCLNENARIVDRERKRHVRVWRHYSFGEGRKARGTERRRRNEGSDGRIMSNTPGTTTVAHGSRTSLVSTTRLGVVGDVGETGGGDFEREGSTAFVSVARLDMFARVARGEKMSKVLGPEDAEGRPG